MKIIVGSKNPVKVGAVEEAFKRYFKDCEVVGLEVESGVSAQPMSELETMNGARQRAYSALRNDESADYGVGLEGGVTEVNPTSPNWSGVRGRRGRMFECAWVAIVSKDGREGLGGGLYFELPEKVAEKLRAGGELGPVMDEMSGENNVKQKMGAIGMFTKGELDRKQAYVQIVLSAMIKFVSPEWFKE
jgi:inosine/xanthosine triphosphatase